MIVTQRDGEFLFFTQADHAAFAGALMALWRRDGLAEHPQRQELLLAIREHDNGWREADAAPRIDSAGRPLTFNRVSTADRISIWRRGVHRFAAEAPFTAQLILKHAVEIHRNYWESAGWEGFREELSVLEATLTEAAGGEALGGDYRFLELADALSLGACGAPVDWASGTLGGYRFSLGLGRVVLNPFPLAGATTLQIAYRTLTKKPFADAPSLAAELAAATWKRLPIRIEPLESE